MILLDIFISMTTVPDLKMRNRPRALGLSRQYTRLPDMSKVPSPPLMISNAVPTVPQPKLSPKASEEEVMFAKEVWIFTY